MSTEDSPPETLKLDPGQCTAMANALRPIEDELTDIMECLLQDLTGESKSSLSALPDHVDSAPAVLRYLSTNGKCS